MFDNLFSLDFNLKADDNKDQILETPSKFSSNTGSHNLFKVLFSLF